MPAFITLTSKTDSITFTGTDLGRGWIYKNECLRAWYKLATPDVPLSKKANAHGFFDPKRLYAGKSEPMITGTYFGSSLADAQEQRVRLNGFFSDGESVKMTVENTDSGEKTSRTVYMTDCDPDWNHFWEFDFEISFVAPDPRRYGDLVNYPDTKIPSASSGLVWPLGSSSSGLYFDWGTPGESGQIVITNPGNATAYPTIIVGGGGVFTAGARIVEIETGDELTYPLPIDSVSVLTLNSRTHRARLGLSDVTDDLTSRDWFSIPPKGKRTYQINPLGPTTGSPTYRATLAPTNL